MKNEKWLYLFIGFLGGVVVMLLYLLNGPFVKKDSIETENENTNDDVVSSEVTQYDTTPKDFSFEGEDGVNITMHTPDGWYDLSEQYIDTLGTNGLLGENTNTDGLYVVGDSDTQSGCENIVYMCQMSAMRNILKEVIGEEYNDDTHLYSDIYKYMKNGEIPENTDNLQIEEIDSIVDGNNTFRVFYVTYTQVYETGVSGNSTEEIIHQLNAYSTNDDAIEVILYMTNFNKDTGYEYLKECIKNI